MEVNKNQDSLRQQMLDEMDVLCTGYYGNEYPTPEEYLDDAIMPVLEKAMAAGELLLHRATTPQEPVPERIVTWLDGCVAIIATMRKHKDITTTEALGVLYQLEDGAHRALADAKQLNPAPQKTTKGLLGKLLAGKPLPMKG